MIEGLVLGEVLGLEDGLTRGEALGLTDGLTEEGDEGGGKALGNTPTVGVLHRRVVAGEALGLGDELKKKKRFHL